MAVRTAYVPVAGAVLTATNLAKVAGGWIGYNEVTANQAGIVGTVTDLTGLTHAVTVGTGRRVRVTASIQWSSTGAGEIATCAIQEGATVLQSRSLAIAGAGTTGTMEFSVVMAPTSGAHTYKLTLVRATAVGSVTMVATAAAPSFILTEDLGSTP